jgi:hypothetical protein
MTEGLEAGLLLDLVSLSRRYGPETIMSLCDRLRRQGVNDGVLKLLYVLQNSELIIDAVYHSSQSIKEASIVKKTANKFDKIGEEDVGGCVEDIYSGRLFPDKSDIVTFAKGNQINLYGKMDRNSLAIALINHLTWLTPNARRQFLFKVNHQNPGSNSLQGWAGIILEGKRPRTNL